MTELPATEDRAELRRIARGLIPALREEFASATP
jgi:hypothetical protein